ncbi:hypothetical protein BDV95DRAFT_603403 [Massariosphaeria phaeospora]|uniref:Uncharacterized protein n=1 Tax=Massariosphaeria phaeospora TaxID=100035 RepID=A0A7C8IM70_9PLEO|nr:hypothetical protein BDV95DRAFT_603403 [Massariosphaeria phaeospora]
MDTTARFINISETTLEGPRCLICADVLPFVLGREEYCCPAHNPGTAIDQDEVELGFEALSMLDSFKRLVRAAGLVKGPPLPPLPDVLDGAERRIMETAWLLARQCEHSALVTDPRSPFVAAEEIEFYAGPVHGYMHSAFAIYGRNGKQWVFDPTGVQFGADWPLVMEMYDYGIVFSTTWLAAPWAQGGVSSSSSQSSQSSDLLPGLLGKDYLSRVTFDHVQLLMEPL